jgi:dTMP kinase
VASVSEEIAALRGTRPATFRTLLRDPAFSRLYRAILVSSLGDWIGFVAVVALVTRIGGGSAGFAVSGVMLARLLPSILFGPFAGVLVDRFDRKRLMVIADVSRGIGYATLPLFPRLPWIYTMSFLIECMSLLWTPARDAIIPNLVPRRQLSNANTIALATGYGTLPLGGIAYTAITALAVSIGGSVAYVEQNPESIALWLDALTFFFSAWMISGLVLRRTGRPTKQGRLKATEAFSDLKEGVVFLKDHAFARAMTIGIVLAFTGAGAVISVGPIFASAGLDGGPTAWGFLVTALGVGMALGMVFVGQVTKVVEKDTLFPLAILGGGAALLVVAAMPSIVLAALATVAMGAAAGATWVTGYTLLHENVTDELRGRVFGTLTVLARLGLFLSLAGFPLLAQALNNFAFELGAVEIEGTRMSLWVGAGVMIVGGILSRVGLAKSRLTRPRPLRLFPRLRKTERRGTFIVFEGVEGAGKGTQVRLAREFLEELGHPVLVTREPGGTELGERLRDSLLDHNESVDSRAEALLFAASRAQHVSRVIRPALEEGKVVLCDRYLDSSLAYQGTGRGLGEQDVLSLNVWATQGLFPDLVMLLHLEPDRGLARIGTEQDRIEAEDESFHAKVADAFLRIAEDHPERFRIINADAPPDVVHTRIRDELQKFLGQDEEKDES